VLNMPLSVIGSAQGPALGSAIHAAVAAGAYPDVASAAASMGRLERAAFRPDEANAAAYDPLFEEYVRLHDHFGRGGNDVMKRLKALRRKAVASRSESGATSTDPSATALEASAGGEAA
jgi:L-ribulokinase